MKTSATTHSFVAQALARTILCLIFPPLLTAAHGAERLDRGVVAVPAPPGGTLVSWRFLRTDAPNAGFDLYGVDAAGKTEKLDPQPITNASCFLVPPGKEYRDYQVRQGGVAEVSSGAASRCRMFTAGEGDVLPYYRVKFQGNYPASKVVVADLDGDGALDFVIKQPEQVTDPGVWHKSQATFKVEAYRSDGTFLWHKDLGWNIEQGIWYSPMVVCDLDGDGKAEVVVKTAPLDKDYRNDTGRVLDGPEWCSVLDGMTGAEICRVDWILRGKVSDWGDEVGNRASRHMLGVAWLDGKRPSLLVHRGTYTTMRLDVYNLVNKKLVPVWNWNGDDEKPRVRGQGLHGIQVADIDDDGRDEVILGSAALDDNGKLLWNTGLGHADACYVADIDPARPGLEIMYGIEPPHQSNAICLVEARTGKIIWGCAHATRHAHSQGLLADIDPENPGMEFYMGEKQFPDRWLYSARTGKLLATEDLGVLAPTPVFWLDGDLKLYVSRERLKQYRGKDFGRIQGRVLGSGDLFGDWREELLATVPGELRIYSTPVPAATRRVCFLQDRQYRTALAMQGSGYFYPPQAPRGAQRGLISD